MDTKKPLSVVLAALLIASIVMITVPVSAEHPSQAIWVEPTLPDSTVDTLHYCDTFTVSVKVNVTNMQGFEFKLYWRRDLLNGTSFTDFVPAAWTSPQKVPLNPADRFKWDFNTTHGRAYYGATNLPVTPVTGIFTLATMTFHVETSVYVPDPALIGILDLVDTKIVVGGTAVPHNQYDGQFRLCPVPVPEPNLRLSPKKVNGIYGQLFNISIEINDLAARRDLWGWEAKVGFNTTHLTGTNSYNGTFLPLFAGPNGTYYINLINNTLGIIHTAGGFLGNHTAPSIGPAAWGQLAALEFNASFQTVAPDIQASDIVLYDTKLVGKYANGTLYYIPHKVVQNTTYNVPYMIVGWFLDCYTDTFRKKCEAKYSGKGINQTADPYEPQDLVILYAYLEYNFEPEAYKMVTFEIHGPPNDVENITIYRTAWTNASGVATISFTIPGSGIPNWEKMVMGHWTCYQAAQVKIYQKPTDWLFFKVGWIIEITKVEVSPGPGGWISQIGPKKLEWINITISFKTIAFIPKNVTFTVTVLDELLDPIQWEFWVVEVEPTEYYLCSERNDTTWTLSQIPMWAHVGIATIYVNAFTDIPQNCGCPYCPEITTTFFVVKTSDP